ncbi:Rieske (2Fe-2S) protein [Carboxylicivirga mesophila]|uniref:Rieske (2Fe-2S) protein n=1 Tax=Carboxylicivirga mesophila TaxID=1166478 RepID=A0ABS5K9Z6_9BACT|nr:Rieske (2Fe-2S) protein [Carboxylicivirga mesophila]MBS2211672.1 Rieske (2Fe-2S) protein [Carboxylicivirga mesophila]
MKKLLTLLSICILALSCQKDSVEIIPNVRFTAEIDLDNPQYTGYSFKAIRDVKGRRIGINGVVICKLTQTEIYAFDLMCTHQHEKTGYFYVDVEPGNDIVTCPECNSEFIISSKYGAVIKGPAKWPLKVYQTSVSNNILRIWN